MPAADDPQPTPQVATPFESIRPAAQPAPQPAPADPWHDPAITVEVDLDPAPVSAPRRSRTVALLVAAAGVLLVTLVAVSVLLINAQSRIRELEGSVRVQDTQITTLHNDTTRLQAQLASATAERDRALAGAVRCGATPTPGASPTASAQPSAVPEPSPVPSAAP